MKRLPVICALLLFGSSAADARPIWDSHSSLICSGKLMYECNLIQNTCSMRESTAIWKLDFNSNTIKYLNFEYIEKIIAKNISKVQVDGDVGEIFLNSGRVMAFRIRASAQDIKIIDAFMIGHSLSVTTTTKFECAPL